MVFSGGKRRAAVLALVLVVAALAGCAEGAGSTGTSTARPLPAGYRWVRVESVGLEFAASSDWTVISGPEVAELSPDSPRLAALAQSVGWEPDVLVHAMLGKDAYLVAPRGSDKGRSSVMVAGLPGQSFDVAAAMNTPTWVDPKPALRRVNTAVGEGVELSSTLSLPGGESHTRILQLDTPRGATSFVLTAVDPATAQAFVDSMVRTIHRT